MKLSHPDAEDEKINEGEIFDVNGNCYTMIDPYIKAVGEAIAASPGGEQRLHHAFMLNDVPYDTNSPTKNRNTPDEKKDPPAEEVRCWNTIHENLLERGVYSESCAVYFWENEPSKDGKAGNYGMGLRFVPCDEEFESGSS